MRFIDQQEIDGAGGLSDIERAQLHAAGLRYDGEDIDAETRLADSGDEESFHGFCTRQRLRRVRRAARGAPRLNDRNRTVSG